MKIQYQFYGLFLSGLLLTGCAMFSGADQGASTVDSEKEHAVAVTPASVAELEVVWGLDVDQRAPRAPFSYARPVLADDLIVIGGQDRFVHIYNLQGVELRRVPLPEACDSDALAMSAGLVVLGDVRGVLYGIDPQQGRILWHLALSSVMLGHPVRVGDDMLVQTGDNSVYRISAKGEKIWSFSGAQSGLGLHLNPSPLVDGDAVYAMLSNGDAVALRSDSGDLIWRRQLLLDNDAVVLGELKSPLADPMLVGDVLIVSLYQGSVVALSAHGGQQLWQRNISLKSAPLLHQGRLFAVTADAAVMALDPASGATLWTRKPNAGELIGSVLWQQRVFAADDRGNVFAFGLDGKTKASINLPGRFDRAPVATSVGVLLRNNLGGLYLVR
ncbi:MAG: PQQ-binding-like beta-propeller repeat protein [Mariprofundaceae bacterium]